MTSDSHIANTVAMPSIEAGNSRKSKVERLATLIWEHLCRDFLSEIKETGTLCPTNCLRHRVTTQRLLWASNVNLGGGRWFTQGMIKDALAKVVDRPGFELPETPGFTKDGWLSATSSSLSKLLSRARRSTVSPAQAAMDCDETQVWDSALDPWED